MARESCNVWLTQSARLVLFINKTTPGTTNKTII